MLNGKSIDDFIKEQGIKTEVEKSKSIRKLGFRVGINEGIIIARSKLESEKFELFTDGLLGCVGLVVTNSKHVFMVHVSSLYYGGSIDNSAERYLKRVIAWMNENDNGNIQVGLAASGENSGLYNIFSNARGKCKKDIAFITGGVDTENKFGGKCKVAFDSYERLVMDGSFERYAKSYDVIGSLSRPDLVVARINACDSEFKFGSKEGDMSRGDYDHNMVIYNSLCGAKWITNEKLEAVNEGSNEATEVELRLLMAFKNLCRAVDSIIEAKKILILIDEIARKESIHINIEDRTIICEELPIFLHEHMGVNIGTSGTEENVKWYIKKFSEERAQKMCVPLPDNVPQQNKEVLSENESERFMSMPPFVRKRRLEKKKNKEKEKSEANIQNKEVKKQKLEKKEWKLLKNDRRDRLENMEGKPFF